MLIDTHTHVLPDVDDGSLDMDMTMDIIKSCLDQHVTALFATSHSFAFLDGVSYIMPVYQNLMEIIRSEGIPIQIYLGCEVLCMPHLMKNILQNLQDGAFPTMNGTKYVLIEFTIWNMEYPDVTSCVMQLLGEGWIPVLAHVERYVYTWATIDNLIFFKNLGCLVQMNTYSLVEETDAAIKSFAKEMLDCKLVDVVGSDTHGSHHRPPMLQNGVDYMYANYDKDYIDEILYQNAIKYFKL